MVLSNTRHCPHGSGADLSSTYHRFAASSFFQPAPPCPYPRDQSAFHAIPAAFLQHCQEAECQPLDIKQLRSRDVWSLSLSRVTLGFDGARRFPRSRTQPFVESFAMSLWVCQPSAFKNGSPSSPEQEDALLASVHFLVHVITPVKMWLNHYQYVALLRMKDAMARLLAELSRNLQYVKKIHRQKTNPSSVCLALLVDSAEVGLLLPAACSEPEGEVPHSPETETPSMTDSDVSPTHRSADVVVEENGLNATFAQDEQEGVVEEAYEAVEEGLECLTAREDTPVVSPPLSPVLSREPSTFSLEGELSSAINVTKDVTKDAISASLDLTKGALSITKDAFSMLSRGSGMSKLFTSQAKWVLTPSRWAVSNAPALLEAALSAALSHLLLLLLRVNAGNTSSVQKSRPPRWPPACGTSPWSSPRPSTPSTAPSWTAACPMSPCPRTATSAMDFSSWWTRVLRRTR